MYGDPDRLVALAASIEQRADDVRTRAREMVNRGDATQWAGLAAERHREALRDDAAAFTRCAGRLDDAAAALRAHAEKVRETIALIATAERRVTAFFHDAEGALRSGVHAVEHVASSAVHEAEHVASSLVHGAAGLLGHPGPVTTPPAPPWSTWPWTPSSPPAQGSKDWLTLAGYVDRHGSGAA